MSAGVVEEDTWRQSVAIVCLRIRAAILAMNVFDSALMQTEVISELDRNVGLLKWIFIVCCTFLYRSESSKAARSSSLGKVTVFRGATLLFIYKRCTCVFP